MARERNSNSFDIDFKTPLTAPKPAGEPGPAIMNAPIMNPRDPLGLVTDIGGSRGGTIKGD